MLKRVAHTESHRPLPKISKKTQQITVRVGDNELTVAEHGFVAPISFFLHRQDDVMLGCTDARVNRVGVGDLDLHVDTPAITLIPLP